MRMVGQGAGLRMLKQTMLRMVKGEVAMRLKIWGTAFKAEVGVAASPL